jgi:membrane-associated phospholipid phosphatase
VLATAGAAPVALCVVRRRTPARDVAVVCLQMWAYVAAYEMPHDDPERLSRRVRVDYVVDIDTFLGGGLTPTVRLQRWLSRPGRITPLDRPLVWAHWLWFFVPHSCTAYILAFRPERFPRAAAQMYAVFDVGAIFYWVLPTAPPWYAAQLGRMVMADGEAQTVRRMMTEYGEEFWRDRWQSLYSLFGGNPLAAMPSLHFATALMAAHLLTEVGPVEGAVGWTYCFTLGLALVYLGEHYLVDLIAGAALTEGVRRGAPVAAPVFERLAEGVGRLEAWARA